jgi:hypothetical protein
MKENPEDVIKKAGKQICREVTGTSHLAISHNFCYRAMA